MESCARLGSSAAGYMMVRLRQVLLSHFFFLFVCQVLFLALIKEREQCRQAGVCLGWLLRWYDTLNLKFEIWNTSHIPWAITGIPQCTRGQSVLLGLHYCISCRQPILHQLGICLQFTKKADDLSLIRGACFVGPLLTDLPQFTRGLQINRNLPVKWVSIIW